MDVAPYIKDGRTFLPLRYVANALDVDDDNIIWDPVSKAVTIFKGDRIAQVTIGSKTMLVNGVTINMDVAPEITDERTMLPIRWMGQALGASIDWNAASSYANGRIIFYGLTPGVQYSISFSSPGYLFPVLTFTSSGGGGVFHSFGIVATAPNPTPRCARCAWGCPVRCRCSTAPPWSRRSGSGWP